MMGWRFQWRPRLGPFQLNFGKRGVSSVTMGRRGAHLNLSPRGRRVTVGLPGSGLSYSQYVPWHRHIAENPWWARIGLVLLLILIGLVVLPNVFSAITFGP
jgi:hypothetical protein